jgi:nitrous oxide reductase accessory protein NosL
MRKILLVLVAFSMFLVAGSMQKNMNMKNYRAVPMQKAQIVQEGKGKMFCKVCGMTLPMFYKTNHAAKVNGKVHQYCSIHCMVEEAVQNGGDPVDPQVIDNATLKFISVTKAYYVVGSKKPGTMSMVSKYAFGTKSAAQAFAKKFGGKIMRYTMLEKMVKKNLKKEIAGIRKKQAKMAKMGRKIYNKKCKVTEKRFHNPAMAKIYIKNQNLCGNIKGKPFQAVALYLSGR